MSHAIGVVRFQDGTIKYYEYDGTADVCLPILRNTQQEVMDHWRESEWPDCTCGQAPEKVEIYTTYGFGYTWTGTACKRCAVITDGAMPSAVLQIRPDWLPEGLA